MHSRTNIGGCLSEVNAVTVTEIKGEYNKLLKRFWKAYAYLENTAIPDEEKQEWIPDYMQIIYRLSAILVEFRRQGIQTTHEQRLHGF
jgi:hypothetical protein